MQIPALPRLQPAAPNDGPLEHMLSLLSPQSGSGSRAAPAHSHQQDFTLPGWDPASDQPPGDSSSSGSSVRKDQIGRFGLGFGKFSSCTVCRQREGPDSQGMAHSRGCQSSGNAGTTLSGITGWDCWGVCAGWIHDPMILREKENSYSSQAPPVLRGNRDGGMWDPQSRRDTLSRSSSMALAPPKIHSWPFPTIPNHF